MFGLASKQIERPTSIFFVMEDANEHVRRATEPCHRLIGRLAEDDGVESFKDRDFGVRCDVVDVADDKDETLRERGRCHFCRTSIGQQTADRDSSKESFEVTR
jgi:hypothetical protein